MSQVFSNLVGNALQHGRPESIVSVAISGVDSDVLTVHIRNEGAIPPERMKTLFEPFQPGSTSHGGLGLGLYIASQFVQAHGGNVKASTGHGDETIFEFSIPRKPAAGAGKSLKVSL